MYTLEISEAAEKDILNSTDFYEDKQRNLGKRFFNVTLTSFELILQTPYAYTKINNNLHKYIITKFPFIILYRITDTFIYIIAVFHTSRNPEIIKNRLNPQKD